MITPLSRVDHMVRVEHTPTGTVVVVREPRHYKARSPYKSKLRALRVLKAKLHAHAMGLLPQPPRMVRTYDLAEGVVTDEASQTTMPCPWSKQTGVLDDEEADQWLAARNTGEDP